MWKGTCKHHVPIKCSFCVAHSRGGRLVAVAVPHLQLPRLHRLCGPVDCGVDGRHRGAIDAKAAQESEQVLA